MNGTMAWNSSYVFAIDNESGWGERYFFTYYSEFDGRPLYRVVSEILVFSLLFLSSVIANVWIVLCVVRYPDMKTVTNCFVLNLSAADLLFATTIPAVAYVRIVASWKLGDFACRFIPYVQFVSGIVLLWTLALISMDRYRCIVVPPYRSTITPRQAVFCSSIIWLATSIVFIPVLLWFKKITSDEKIICTLVFPNSDHVHFSACFVMPVVIFACLLPMFMLVYYYQRIFRKILSTKNTWASSCVMVSTMEIKEGCNRVQGRRQSELSISDIFVPWPRKFSAQMATSPKSRQGSLSQHEEIRLNRHIRVVRVLFVNVLAVLIMWLPITVVMLLIYFDGARPTEDKNYFLRSYHFIAALIFAFINTLVNPVLYGALSDSFRACLVRMCWCRKKDDVKLVGVKEQATPSSGRKNGNSRGVRKQSFASVSEN